MAQSQMHREILEIPAALERLLSLGTHDVEAAAEAIAARPQPFAVTIARGSSDHAASFFKYASELLTGRVVASLGPSVASLYGSALQLAGSTALAISQSGKSPDIVMATKMAGEAGALTVAVTNDPSSELTQCAELTLPLHAGEERSVAATKTFVSSSVLAAWVLAQVAKDEELLRAIKGLPAALHNAYHTDWGSLANELASARSLFCLGRGPTNAIASEAALKFKETSRLHAQAYSSAEVLHGPVAIVHEGFPVIAFATPGAAEASVVEVADALAGMGAQTFVTSPLATRSTVLPRQDTGHPLTDAIALIVSFYTMVETLARVRGLNPDMPRHLQKVTRTR